MITEEDVMQMYRLVLGREPESQEVVENHMKAPSIRLLLWEFVRSEEFLERYRLPIRVAFNV
jgi:hypothetical protein